MWGSGATYTVGQNNNAEGPWPRTNLNDFTRWIDFSQPATRATATTWAVPVQGGAAAQAPFNQYAGPANLAWGSSSRSGHAVGLPQGRADQRGDARCDARWAGRASGR
jgi:hypothetical protein